VRPPVAAGAVAGFLLLCAAAVVGGRSLEQPSVTIGLDDLPTEIPMAEDGGPEADAMVETASSAAGQTESTGMTSDPPGFERVAPREPLSKLSLALPPKPKMPDEWKGTILHRAVAPSAGIIEAMGYTVAIAGVEPVAADETCGYEGKEWECGVHARTAFRAFLRGRSPTCTVPPEPDRETVAADCQIGKQDVGEWLVSNGWARAAASGPYAEAGAKAREAKLGLFGPPPSKGGLPALPKSYPPLDATVRDAPSIEILAPDAATPSFETLTPPAGQPTPFQ
jgi:endonuclease YncB( thermonuclease family)